MRNTINDREMIIFQRTTPIIILFGLVVTSYPSICHDNQVKLLPMSLIASCEANESRAQFSVVSLEEIKLTETTKNGNNISRHVSFDSRDSSFSTNERFEILF